KDYPKWVLPYANLEDAGDPVQVAELASQAKQMAGQARNPYSAARNIEAALRNDETYTLKPPPAPAGTWPVLYFLDTSHRGYCQYFAAAMGAMLRALGIPSRLAGGYDAGVDGTVTRADAHVWVQAYFPRYGWINFEPTPPASFERHPHHQAGGGASATTTPTPAPGSPGGLGARFHPGVRQLTSNAHPGTGHKPAGAGPLLLALGGSAGGLLLLLLLLLLWWSSQVRSPNQLRSRLGLLVRVAHGGHPPSLTLHEMAQITSQLSSRAGLEVRLQELADRAERISFGPATAPANLRLTGWAPVGRRYLALLWQAWREGQRTRSEAAPISVDLLAAGSS
ncbi:MAG TPA: transglutaminase-like domain-containing protein, partial [Candidatus Dormibacteraeota bacterium]